MSRPPLPALLTLLRSRNVQAYIIPSADAHGSEYIHPQDARRELVSGFTGSAGTAVVTTTKEGNALWTDGRYFLQASQELDASHWILQKAGLPETPTIAEWLNKILPPKSKVAFDPKLVTEAEVHEWKKEIYKEHSVEPITENLIDQVWNTNDAGKGKPEPPHETVYVLEEKYAGTRFEQKIATVRRAIEKAEGLGLVIAALDEIAWLFNLRGCDIPYNPVFFAYAYVCAETIVLHIDDSKVTKEATSHLGKDVQVRPYQQIYSDLAKLAATEQKKILIPQSANYALQTAHTNSKSLRSPIQLAKMIKNTTEMEGFRQCHIRDAAALINYFAWLEDQLASGTKLSEVEGADKLEQFRSEQPLFKGLSFDTISGSGPNGAIIHYKPEVGKCRTIAKDQVYLCDSGGQYMDGTTDVTRTVHFGTPSAHEIRMNTLVLRGHIDIATLVFPKKISGYVLDCTARRPLWQIGQIYQHGTGHGVGSFLNVHEGPQGLGFRKAFDEVGFEAGMSITNEPGYYEKDGFGIRIENVLLTVERQTEFGKDGFLGFENVTVVPYDRKLIDVKSLSKAEMEYINEYHKECWQKVSPLLSGRGLDWLKRETKEL